MGDRYTTVGMPDILAEAGVVETREGNTRIFSNRRPGEVSRVADRVGRAERLRGMPPEVYDARVKMESDALRRRIRKANSFKGEDQGWREYNPPLEEEEPNFRGYPKESMDSFIPGGKRTRLRWEAEEEDRNARILENHQKTTSDKLRRLTEHMMRKRAMRRIPQVQKHNSSLDEDEYGY